MVVGSAQWRQAQARDLFDFALGALCPEGGFGWLDDRGRVDRSHDRELWINCRMTYVAALGAIGGHEGCRAALDHGLAGLTGLFQDQQYDGWHAAIGWDGRPSDTAKTAYPHAFVVLAAAAAVVAGAPSAPGLLAEALRVADTRFWDPEPAMMVEEWDRTFTRLDPYRGVNANMHWVEALLAGADVLDWLGRHPVETPGMVGGAFPPRPGDETETPGTVMPPHSGDTTIHNVTAEASPVSLMPYDPQELRRRALAITERVINREARANDWRVPEHFDAAWNRQSEYNRDRPADPFRPYGATIGHGLEWARLCLQLQASLPDHPGWLSQAAQGLYDRALADGWSVDGKSGFVYTTDWQGQPIFTRRMHWVVAEAIGAGAALQAAGLRDTTAAVQTWWDYADTHLIDHESGSWCHELDPDNHPSATVWSGRPDVYHGLQACFFQDLPLAPCLCVGLRAQSQDRS